MRVTTLLCLFFPGCQSALTPRPKIAQDPPMQTMSLTGQGAFPTALPTHMEWLIDGAACLTEVLSQKMPQIYAHELAARFGSTLAYPASLVPLREGQVVRVVLPDDGIVVSLEDGEVAVSWGSHDHP